MAAATKIGPALDMKTLRKGARKIHIPTLIVLIRANISPPIKEIKS
jgi:hypothetical protein